MRVLVACSMLSMLSPSATADSVYSRSTAGDEQLVARDVLVTRVQNWDQGRGVAVVTFQYWHPRRQLLAVSTLSANTGASFRVERSDPDARRQILSGFFEKGVRGSVSAAAGNVREVYCLRHHYVRRGVRYVGVTAPEDDTTLEYVPLSGPGASTRVVQRLGLAELRSIEFTGEKSFRLVTSDGRQIEGEVYDNNLDVYLHGLDSQGGEYSIRRADILKIEFGGAGAH